MITTGFYAALLGLWLVFLYVRVVRRRLKHGVSLGDGGQEDLKRAIRIHGNFIETVPYILILMILVETLAGSVWFLHGLGIALVLSRILHFDGLSLSQKIPNSRQVAGVLTLAVVIVPAAILLWQTVPAFLN